MRWTARVAAVMVGTWGVGATGCDDYSPPAIPLRTTRDAAADATTGPGCGDVLSVGIPTPLGYSLPTAYVVVDREAVYWMDSGGNLRRVPKHGGLTQSLTNQAPTIFSGPTAIAVSDNAVYFGQNNGGSLIQRVPKTGGDVTTVARTETGIDGLVVDSSYVYWITRVTGGANLWRVPLDGGTPMLLSSMLYLDTRHEVVYIAVDDTNLYATAGGFAGPTDGAVFRIAKDGSAVTKIADGLAGPRDLTAADPDFVYFGIDGTENNFGAAIPPTGKIARVPKNATGPVEPTIIATDQVEPNQIAFDGANVYWINFGDQLADTSMIDTTIVRIAPPAAGDDAGSPASPTVLGACQWSSWSMTVDDTSIYYIDWQGSVRVLDK